MKINYSAVALFIFVLFLAFLLYNFYYSPDTGIVAGSGTILDDNWWTAMNWIKDNTPSCAVVATYWDPGYFITGIANRSVVFDGATQNAQMIIDREGNLTDAQILELAPTGKYTVQRTTENGTLHTIVTTARIQDIGTTLLTSNETLAYDILKRYNKPGCNEMYFLATADLVGKAHWWSYFSTWNPTDKGTASDYVTLSLTQSRPVVQQNAIAYTYAISQQQAFVVLDTNDSLSAYLQQGTQVASVERLFYVNQAGQPLMTDNPNAQMKGTVWLDPTRQAIIFMPPELQDSLFTKMFFFNGAGLTKFQLVNNWGGEVKLFKMTIS